MTIENNTVIDLKDEYDKTFDHSVRFILQDPFIQSLLLKDFCKEVKNMDIVDIESLLRLDTKGNNHSRIELIDGISKIQGLIERNSDFVYRIDLDESHFFVDIEAQRNYLNIRNIYLRGQDYCKRINVAEQIRNKGIELSFLGKVYCFFICFFDSSNDEEVIFYKGSKSTEEDDNYIPADGSMFEVTHINLNKAFEELKYTSVKLLWILFRYPMSFDDRIRMLKEELNIELEEESREETRKMCDYLNKIAVDNRNEGITEGIEIGIDKGILITLNRNIKSLMKKGYSFDEICDSLELDSDTRKELINTGEFYLN